jgi:NTP pyrophosphatase (non-canonical NTP hydrolase)
MLRCLRRANIKREKERDPDGKCGLLLYRATELGGEVGEALNVCKKLAREQMRIVGSRSSVAQLADELADVVIATDLLAMACGIDLEAATRAKFNATSDALGLATKISQ